jgi:hypothetical protein
MASSPESVEDHLAIATAANASLGGSRSLEYKGVNALVPLYQLESALDTLRAFPDRERQKIVRSAVIVLGRNLLSVREGKAPIEVAMHFAEDMVIWFANEVIEGRASLSLN